MAGYTDKRLYVVSALLFGMCAASPIVAQTYPNKPIRVIAGGSPGGSIDFIARIVGQKASPALGQQMIIENRGGGGGNLAAEAAARATPDGYALLVIGASIAINPSIYRKLPYEPAKDFVPITQATAAGYVLALHPAVPAGTVKEFIALAKSRKDAIAYASPGSGQAQHLGMEMLSTIGGFKAVHIPYKGGAPAVTGVAGGEADITMASIPAALPLLQTGKLKAIAVSSLKRMDLLPNVPTIAESAIPGFEVSGWIAFFAPAGTPREVVARLHDGISKALSAPEVRDALKATGQETVASTPDEFSAYFKAELVKWAKVAKQSGAKVD
ncbi:MAG: tripartite tricarboxylate transporter substrate binding protein [Burkholderiales bacterium]|nr:tripartite tricarboxylate transporter substrate binding protein [Burkholderiales bacterium]